MTEFQEDNTGGNNEPENTGAGAEAAPQRKERKPRTATPKPPKLYPQWNEDGTPLLGEDGLQVMGETKQKKPKAPKPPKEVEYQKDENGEYVLDEEGNKIPVKKARKPRLDADGNPVPRGSNVFLDSQRIHRTEKGQTAQYKEGSDRQRHFAAMTDGKTVGEFYAEMGGKAASHRFLVHQLNVLGTITID